MENLNATQQFLGAEAQWPAARIELHDVQGLWGGRRIHVAGTQRVMVQRVESALRETRYEFTLRRAELKRLLDLFVENDFLTIRPLERAGIPDEARPSIRLVNAGGEEWAVAKWAGVADKRFDTLYQALLQLEALAPKEGRVGRHPPSPGRGQVGGDFG